MTGMGEGLLMAYGIPLAVAVVTLTATRVMAPKLAALAALAVALAAYVLWVLLA